MNYTETLLRCAGMLSPAILLVLAFAPYIGRWCNMRATDKTLRLLHATVPGPAKYFPWSEWALLSMPAPRPPRES